MMRATLGRAGRRGRAWAGARLPAAAHAGLLAAAVACGDAPTAVPPADAVPLDPVPAYYAMWWRLTEQCSGRTGDFAAVRWYADPSPQVVTGGTDPRAPDGRWYPGGNQIVLRSGFDSYGELVRHEMLHALLRRPGHQRVFLDGCGGVVGCDGPCAVEAGGSARVPADAPVVTPAALAVGVSVFPDPVVKGANGGWAVVTVRATNPTPRAVRVRLARPAGGGAPRLFTWELGAAAGGGAASGDTLVGFGPGETRRMAFDVLVNAPSPWALASGAYVAVGRFNAQPSAPLPVVVRP